MRTRIATIVIAAALACGMGVALGSRPAASLPDGTVVDLNTGIATAADGHHYKVSPAELATLRQQASQRASEGHEVPSSMTVTAPAAATGRPPR